VNSANFSEFSEFSELFPPTKLFSHCIQKSVLFIISFVKYVVGIASFKKQNLLALTISMDELFSAYHGVGGEVRGNGWEKLALSQSRSFVFFRRFFFVPARSVGIQSDSYSIVFPRRVSMGLRNGTPPCHSLSLVFFKLLGF
jgi:hypothetical protein